MAERWENYLTARCSYLTEDYLQVKYPLKETEDNLVVAGHIFATKKLADAILKLEIGQKLLAGNNIIA